MTTDLQTILASCLNLGAMKACRAIADKMTEAAGK